MEILKQVFINGGWVILVYAFWRVAIWVVRKTETKVDDNILDNYVSVAIDYALKVIPKKDNDTKIDTKINWVKFVGNALGKFSEAYTKEQGDSPDMTTFEKAKKLIEETASNIELKDIKDVLAQYKENKEVA